MLIQIVCIFSGRGHIRLREVNIYKGFIKIIPFFLNKNRVYF